MRSSSMRPALRLLELRSVFNRADGMHEAAQCHFLLPDADWTGLVTKGAETACSFWSRLPLAGLYLFAANMAIRMSARHNRKIHGH